MFGHEHLAETNTDVVLIGAGIMSATLGTFLKELQPDWNIEIFERLDKVAAESSDAWNNAGTGHSALCELNYTPEKPDGTIDISKALKVAEQFQVSRQMWAYLVEKDYIHNPSTFINSIPHMSFVWGEKNVEFLRKRHDAMLQNQLFAGMEFSDDPKQLREWIPLVMEGRDDNVKLAATRTDMGTDLNFGALTRSLFSHLEKQSSVTLHLNHEVTDLHKSKSDGWHVRVTDTATGEHKAVKAKFVFIGAGGGALTLLEKSDIPAGAGYGGFPVSGLWLRCKNQEVIDQHHAKVYGKPAVGSPPMSQPHLDSRMIDGKREMLFGPYAGFSTKFLKEGSYFDLVGSITRDNILPMIDAGLHNFSLTKYLIEQVLLTPEERFKELLTFMPTAQMDDWELRVAGQRVQIIKKEDGHGVIEFGTEVVNDDDGSLAALLGASPGGSTSVAIMLDVLAHCFKDNMQSDAWQTKLKEMVPSYGQSLAHDAELAVSVRQWTGKILGLEANSSGN